MNHDLQKGDDMFGAVYVDSNTFTFCKLVVITWTDEAREFFSLETLFFAHNSCNEVMDIYANNKLAKACYI